MPINYTDAGKVAAALSFQAPETLNASVNSGATSITLNNPPPSDWQVGSTLILDANNPTLRETVTISAAPIGSTIPISATVNAHVQDSPVIDGTLVENYVSAASRWFDSLTFTPAGFGFESYTDEKESYVTNQGYIVIPLSKPVVKLSDITSVTFQSTPIVPADTLNLTKARIRNSCVLEIVPSNLYCERSGIATVNYSGGFNPIPDDISLAVTMLAARLYKERDSGYSDVIGSAETGIFQYKKALPADVNAIVQRYRRWIE